MTREEHYTDGRRWSHISNAWILLSSWNAREELAAMTAAAESVRLENVRQRTLIEQQAQELAELREWKQIILGTGTDQEAVIRMAAMEYTKAAIQTWKEANDKQAKEIARLQKLSATFLDRMNTYGQWEDGCFYYNGISASELQEVIYMAEALKKEHP